MIDLSQASEHVEVSLLNGTVIFKLSPLTAATYSACELTAGKHLSKLKDGAANLKDYGVEVDKIVDFDDLEFVQGVHAQFLMQELAIRHLVSWEGVILDGEDAPLTEKNIRAVVSIHPVGKQFFEKFTLNNLERFIAKKD